jgi:hypothetical protein
MSKIIVSYRRSDSAAIAGRIFDRLAHRYGDASVFMDIDKIPLGVHFEEHLREVLRGADIVLAVIGPNWLGRSPDGSSRIMDADDPVRFEIETALKFGVTTIPVLVDGAAMPRPDDVPAGMRPFTYFNAATVDVGRDFRAHMDRLIHSIGEMHADQRQAAAHGRHWLILSAMGTAVAAITLGIFMIGPRHWFDGAPTAETKSEPTAVTKSEPAPKAPPQERRAQPATYRVLANVSGGVQNLRRGPAVRYPVVVAIPAGATGIVLGQCRKAEDRTRPWCAATWRNHSGWISSCCVVDEKTGAPPQVE